jgi:hypothetical protein
MTVPESSVRFALTEMARVILLCAVLVLLLPFIVAAITLSSAGAIAAEARRGLRPRHALTKPQQRGKR